MKRQPRSRSTYDWVMTFPQVRVGERRSHPRPRSLSPPPRHPFLSPSPPSSSTTFSLTYLPDPLPSLSSSTITIPLEDDLCCSPSHSLTQLPPPLSPHPPLQTKHFLLTCTSSSKAQKYIFSMVCLIGTIHRHRSISRPFTRVCALAVTLARLTHFGDARLDLHCSL